MKKLINKNEKGITLIALVITIIVLLLLAGVAISMLSGENGIINKTTEATYETEIGEIKEALGLKITELLAINEGKVQEYSLTLDNLNISDELKTLYGNKLKISKDGKLCYDATVVTNTEEQNKFKELGIEEFVENNTGNEYIFTLGEFMQMEGVRHLADGFYGLKLNNFWPDNVSDELKESKYKRKMGNEDRDTYNVKCLDLNYSDLFDLFDDRPDSQIYEYSYCLMINGDYIGLKVSSDELITLENYTDYADLQFKITMPEE